MKVLHLSAFLEYQYGGAEQVTRDLIARLGNGSAAVCYDGGSFNAECDQYHVAVPFREGQRGAQLFKRSVLFLPHNADDSRIARRMATDHDLSSFDIVHCHDMHWIGVAGRLAQVTGKPLVVTCHQNMPLRVAGTGLGAKIANLFLLWSDRDRRGWLQSAVAIAVPSNFCRVGLKQFCGVDATVIPNWVDEPLSLTPHRQKQPGSMVYVGRLSQEKGFDVLLNALDPHERSNLMVIGDGPLQTRAAASTRWFGHLPRHKALDLVSRCELGIIPSIVDESFSLTALEYRYLGLKIVATRSGAIPEVLNDCPNVWWANKNDPANLAEQIAKAFTEPKTADNLGWQLRHHAATALDAYDRLYDRVLHTHATAAF